MKELPANNSLARQMLFKERLQQLLINKKIFDEVAIGSLFVLFEVITLIYL